MSKTDEAKKLLIEDHEIVVSAKLEAGKRYLCLVNPYWVNIDDLIRGKYSEDGVKIKIVRTFDIEKAIRFVEVGDDAEKGI